MFYYGVSLSSTMLWLLVTVVAAAGCESIGGGLDIVNKTDQTLYFSDTPIRPDGEPWRFETPNCSTSDLALRDEDGAMFVELTDEWCPGQTWTILGKDESTLEDR